MVRATYASLLSILMLGAWPEYATCQFAQAQQSASPQPGAPAGVGPQQGGSPGQVPGAQGAMQNLGRQAAGQQSLTPAQQAQQAVQQGQAGQQNQVGQQNQAGQQGGAGNQAATGGAQGGGNQDFCSQIESMINQWLMAQNQSDLELTNFAQGNVRNSDLQQFTRQLLSQQSQFGQNLQQNFGTSQPSQAAAQNAARGFQQNQAGAARPSANLGTPAGRVTGNPSTPLGSNPAGNLSGATPAAGAGAGGAAVTPGGSGTAVNPGPATGAVNPGGAATATPGQAGAGAAAGVTAATTTTGAVTPGGAAAVPGATGSAAAETPGALPSAAGARGNRLGASNSIDATGANQGIASSVELLRALRRQGVDFDQAYLGVSLAQQFNTQRMLQSFAEFPCPSVQQLIAQQLQQTQQQIARTQSLLGRLNPSQPAGAGETRRRP